MDNDNTTIKSLVELFENTELSSGSFKELKDSNELVNVVKDRIEANGLFCLDVQCGGGKNYSGRQNGKTVIDDEGTITMIAPNHELLGEQKDKLVEEHELDADKINRIRGFARAYPEYPVKEDENYNKIWFDDMTELQRKVKKYYQFDRIKPGHIHNKFGEEAGLVSNPYDEQFNQYSGKFNLIPTSFVGDQSVRDIAFDSQAIFVDEETVGEVRRQPLKASNNVKKVEKAISGFFDDHEKYIQKGIDALNESDDFALDDLTLDRFKEMFFDGEDFYSLLDEFDRFIQKTRKLSVVRRKSAEEIEANWDKGDEGIFKEMVSNVDQTEFSFDNPIEGRKKLGRRNSDLEVAGKVFSTALSRMFQEEANIDSRYFKQIPEFGHIESFSKKLRYHDVEVVERIKKVDVGGELWNNIKGDLESFEEGDGYEIGFIEEEGEVKIYRKENGIVYISENCLDDKGKELPFIQYWKNTIYDLFPLMAEKPVFFLNATFDRSDVEELIPNYVRNYRARQLSLNDRDSFDSIEYRLNDFDRYLIHNTDLAIDYIPVGDTDTSVEEVRSRVPEADIEFEIISTGIKNKDVTVERLKVDRASEEKAGTFTKSSGSYGSLKGGLNKGMVPDVLEYVAERDWAVISYKSIIDGLRANSEAFDRNNTAYYYGSRGKDTLRGKNLLVIGTPYNPPGNLELDFMRTFKTGYSIFDDKLGEAIIKDNDWREYDNPMLQTFQRKYSKDEQYQMIHRVRPLDDNYEGEIKVMGAIPDRIKEEIEYRYEGRRLVDVAVENLRERVEEELGLEEVVERAKTDRVKAKDITEDGSKTKKIHEKLLKEIAEENKGVKFKDGVLSKDERMGRDETYKQEIRQIIERNAGKLDGLSTEEFKEKVMDMWDKKSPDKVRKVIDDMVNENRLDKVEQEGFTTAQKIKVYS